MKMDRAQIINIVNDFLIDEFELEEESLKDEALLKDDLEIESLDFVDIIVVIEKEFKFKVDPQEMTSVRTLKDIYDYIEKKIG